MIPRTRVPAATAILAVLIACDTGATFGSAVELPVGTWGGEDAGVIVTATAAHVHVGCTNGDFPAPIALDEDGRFSVAGDYLLTAYPVAVGPTMPARFAGVVSRGELVMTVAVDDTIAGELVVLGPVSVRLGREPELGPCPICAM
jgi:hypothetical protein